MLKARTCLQSSPTLKMAACQQILLASSSPFTSSSESARHCRPEGKMPRHAVLASLHICLPHFKHSVLAGTFFFQLTDSTPLHFKLGQVGSFSSTIQRRKLYFNNSFLFKQKCICEPVCVTTPLHGRPRLVVYIQNDGLWVTGEITPRLDLDL